MKNDLIERYVYAATKYVPSKTKSDVQKELKTLIDDMLEDRCGGTTPSEKDIRIVLTELGTPAELQEKYDTSGKNCLIGQPYFSQYKSLLKLLLLLVVIGLTLASIIQIFVDAPLPWYKHILNWIDTVGSACGGVFTALTLVFAVLYHKDIKVGSEFSLDNLPEVPTKKEKISKASGMCDIIFSLAVTIIFLFFPSVFLNLEKAIPLFNIEVLALSRIYIILLFGLGVVRGIVKLIEGRYNTKVMITTIGANAISAIAAFAFLLQDNLINPEFLTTIKTILSLPDEQIVVTLFERFNVFFLAVMILALMLDTIESIVRRKK